MTYLEKMQKGKIGNLQFEFELEGRIIGVVTETDEDIIISMPTEKFEEILNYAKAR